MPNGMTPHQAKDDFQPNSHPDNESSGWHEAMSGYVLGLKAG